MSQPSREDSDAHEQLLDTLRNVNTSLSDHGHCFPRLVIDRAVIYVKLGYDDLAAFDAFVVYNLCQKELTDEFVTDLEAREHDGSLWQPTPSAVNKLLHRSLRILAQCTARLGAMRDAARFRAEYNSVVAKDGGESLNEPPNGSNNASFGYSRREIYPWSRYEPSRNTPEAVTEINTYLSSISTKIEAKVTDLPAFDSNGTATGETSVQLGLFAKENLYPGQMILSEKSILTAIRPLEDAICDACGQELDGTSFKQIRQCDGDDCDITFCSEDCKVRALKGYHRPLIENEDEDEDDNVQEETDSARGAIRINTADNEQESSSQGFLSQRAFFCGNSDLTTIGRPKNTDTPEWDLYFLLLTRVIAMSITQQKHPLSLIETKYLWGDFQPPDISADPPRTLPFSVLHNLQYTLDFFATLSLTCPEATPYSPYWLQNFDFWILQTLFAKFRGVANASQSTFDGKPEIASVHPGWCLANHSCAPNVRWTPKGVREFHVRTKEERTWESEEDEKEWKGIKAGEEVFSHYTDVRLSVTERRERLREVLGGDCRCARCLKEQIR